MRLIDADVLKQLVVEPSMYDINKTDVVSLIDETPTIEAEPVRHGEWVKGKWATYPDGYVCDRCSTGYAIPYNYCPNCGAKME